MDQAERSELRGQVLEGRYVFGPCIGMGGTGVVFEATRLWDDARVVIKTMRPLFANNLELARRMRREAEVARKVAHPGIVPVIDEGMLDDGSPYIVLHHAPGESLAHLLRRSGTLGTAETCAIAMRVSSILHAAHQSGFVHRDVKPEHIMLDRDFVGRLRVRLLDFGVCAADTASAEERENERGRVFGTPSYVSPEQAAGDPNVDGRADIFGLAIVMFECLAGRLPFTGSNVASVLRRILREDAPRMSVVARHVGPDLDAIIARAFERERERRFSSARSFARVLGAIAMDRARVEHDLAERLQLEPQRAEDLIPTVPRVVAAA